MLCEKNKILFAQNEKKNNQPHKISHPCRKSAMISRSLMAYDMKIRKYQKIHI